MLSWGKKDWCDCIFKIQGRYNDVFTWKGGKQTIFMRLYEISEKMEDIFQIRFIQKSYEKVVLQVVKDKKTSKTEEELSAYLKDLYKDQFDDGVEIEIQ